MGYQEFVYKVNNIDLFYNKLNEIKDLMQKNFYSIELDGKLYEGYNNRLTLIKFEKNVGDIKKGYNLYIIGERATGKDIILELNTILHQRQRFNWVEEMIWSKNQGEILKNIFQKGKTEYGRLILDVIDGEIEIDQDIS